MLNKEKKLKVIIDNHPELIYDNLTMYDYWFLGLYNDMYGPEETDNLCAYLAYDHSRLRDTIVGVNMLLSKLDDKARFVINFRYHYFTTLKGIANKMGYAGSERVRQIEHKTLYRLAHYHNNLKSNNYFKGIPNTDIIPRQETKTNSPNEIIINGKPMNGDILLPWDEIASKKPISVRLYNVLYRARITHVWMVYVRDKRKIDSIRNLGVKTALELENLMKDITGEGFAKDEDEAWVRYCAISTYIVK